MRKGARFILLAIVCALLGLTTAEAVDDAATIAARASLARIQTLRE